MKIYKVKVNGKVYEVELEAVTEQTGHIEEPKEAVKEEKAAPVVSEGATQVVAPMQGTILKVNVAAGDKVEKGQVVAILEAMKLENEIIAPVSGTVTDVVVSKGQTVNNQDLLIVIG